MLKFVFYAVLAYFAYRLVLMALAWKATQAELDRQTAIAVAKEGTKSARYGMIGGVVAGVGGLVGGLARVGGR